MRSFSYSWTALPLSLFFVLPGCGDADAPATVPEASFLHEYAQAWCDVEQPCCAEDDRKASTSCVSKFEESMLSVYGGQLKGGDPRYGYDGEAAARCVATMRAGKAECEISSVVTQGNPCGPLFKAVFPGAIPPGEACRSEQSDECAPPASGWAYCSPSESSSNEGTCAQWVTVATGAACDVEESKTPGKPARACGADAYCNSAKTCAAYPRKGESCAELPCASGLYCEPEIPVCAELPKKGDPCKYQCAFDLFCSTHSHTCEPVLANGASCVAASDCQSMACEEGVCTRTSDYAGDNPIVCEQKLGSSGRPRAEGAPYLRRRGALQTPFSHRSPFEHGRSSPQLAWVITPFGDEADDGDAGSTSSRSQPAIHTTNKTAYGRFFTIGRRP